MYFFLLNSVTPLLDLRIILKLKISKFYNNIFLYAITEDEKFNLLNITAITMFLHFLIVMQLILKWNFFMLVHILWILYNLYNIAVNIFKFKLS